LTVSKKKAHKFDEKVFNFKKLNELEVRKQYQIKISKRFAAFENLSDIGDINRAWKNIKVNIKISAKESLFLYGLKQQKPWFDEECLFFIPKEACQNAVVVGSKQK
jgi:hypothetical protein